MRTARLVLVSLLVVGCGGVAPSAAAPTLVPGTTPSPSPSPTPSPTPTPKPTPSPAPVISEACAEELGDTRDELDEMDARLDIGLTFSDYSERVGDISVASNRQDVDALTAEGADCLATALLLNEAFLEYIDANDTWNDCIQDTDCTNDSIRSELQGHWSTASDKLDEAGDMFP